MCMAYDTWNTVEHNVNALALAISGLRQMERHGGAHMVERAFDGFAALPAPDKWQDVLGLNEPGKFYTLDDATAAYRRRARTAHPDAGGPDGAMEKLNWAIEQARKELT